MKFLIDTYCISNFPNIFNRFSRLFINVNSWLLTWKFRLKSIEAIGRYYPDKKKINRDILIYLVRVHLIVILQWCLRVHIQFSHLIREASTNTESVGSVIRHVGRSHAARRIISSRFWMQHTHHEQISLFTNEGDSSESSERIFASDLLNATTCGFPRISFIWLRRHKILWNSLQVDLYTESFL